MRGNGWVRVFVVAVGWQIPGSMGVACGCARLNIEAAATLDGIELRFEESVEEGSRREAIAMWEACSGYGTAFPAFSVGTALPRYFHVRHPPEAGPGICGELRGREITLYSFARTPSGGLVWCGEPGKSLAHELGHALGLVDAASANCTERIMASHPGEKKRIDTRRITPEECEQVDRRWLTASEVARQNADSNLEGVALADLFAGGAPIGEMFLLASMPDPRGSR
jgi:hypothetical protein